jgi:hypothetical protein
MEATYRRPPKLQNEQRALDDAFRLAADRLSGAEVR